MDKQRNILAGKKGSGMLSTDELKLLNDKPKGSVKFLMDDRDREWIWTFLKCNYL